MPLALRHEYVGCGCWRRRGRRRWWFQTVEERGAFPPFAAAAEREFPEPSNVRLLLLDGGAEGADQVEELGDLLAEVGHVGFA